MKDWVNTRKTYVNWLSKTKLRKEFSDKIKFDDLSLWWITSLMDKDNRNDTEWYINLNKKLNTKEKNLKIGRSYLLLSIKLIKSFISKLISVFVIKFILSNNFSAPKRKKKRDCFYTLEINFVDFRGKYIDRQYGLLSLKKKKEKVYLIELPYNLLFINKILEIKKKLRNVPLDYIILNSNIGFLDIIMVYLKSIYLMIKTLKILNTSNYFIIKNIDCREILESKLISSFFGPIQEQILKGIALKKSLDIVEPKNFINCYIFFPQSRVQYYYARKANVKNIINYNHAIYTEQNIFWNFNKDDFSPKKTSYYSPQPDIFFCKGKQDFKRLKKIFKNEKIYLIGDLKTEIRPFTFKKQNRKSNKFKRNKVLTILAGETDWGSIVKILNQCDLNNFTIHVESHPRQRKKTFQFFKNNLKKDFVWGASIDKTKLLKNSDFIIFGDTQLGVELAIKNFNVIRVYENEFIPQYDTNNEIPTACNGSKLQQLLRKKITHKKVKQLEKNYFYKYDNKANLRLQKILDKI